MPRPFRPRGSAFTLSQSRDSNAFPTVVITEVRDYAINHKELWQGNIVAGAALFLQAVLADWLWHDTVHLSCIFDDSPDQPTSQYQFIDRTLKSVNGKEDAYIPKQLFVEKMLMNVSIPTLLFAEIPRDHADIPSSENVSYVTLLILGRTGMEQASFQDYEYLKSMLHLFVPRFGRAISRMSDVYLPGDALNLSHEVAGYMMVPSGDTNNLRTFLAMYAKRYMLKSSSETEVLERCLLHMLKMPFELSSAIRYGLILY
ncbi:hypothetical protein AtubIFM56815_004274 [Aspergillus tubingensis]|uniref:Uncharacterized protein n=1 Tax=Aspergillus tubingensis TaxID=5068 RepID=A0A9W6AYS6_ASPTU|nr:hypothetical protein AtubIFM54640_010363 [Aspergillus tubingensis]GLA89784.1 hypothetical protein AtubIFM56815_004274 [Aspergillus tubingensis]GLB14450.1 hypothetical protein AtubIFM61612_001878 [Aspergillus tubingensis]